MTEYTSEPGVVSFLEFGAIDIANSTKRTWGFQTHQRAYDWFMLSRYANDMVTYRKMRRQCGKENLHLLGELYDREMHHPDDFSLNVSKVAALEVARQAGVERPSFIELGSTIFGHIDGMELVREFLMKADPEVMNVSLDSVDWFGIDISEFFNELALQLYGSQYRVHAFSDAREAPKQTDVFFAKGVTLLYAFSSAKTFVETIAKSRLAVFDYSFGMDGEQHTTIGTGKSVTYLSYDAFRKEFERTGKECFVRKGKTSFDPKTKRLWMEGVVGSKEDIHAFIRIDTSFRQSLAAYLSPIDTRRLLQSDCEGMTDWVPLGKIAAFASGTFN